MTKRAGIWLAVSSEAQAATDKVSLEEQEQAARQWCEVSGYRVARTYAVPGYSRRESDVLTAMQDFAAQGITAYADLRETWQRRDIDVLVAYHHSRFGRSSTLHSYVVENTVMAGIQIYCIDGGWIGPDNLRMQVAMGGYSAAGDIDALVRRRKAGIRKRVSRGYQSTIAATISHRYIRNELGRVVSIIPDEAMRPLIEAAARAICSGASWRAVERNLKVDGWDKYPAYTFYNLFFNPTFWGNAGYNFHNGRSAVGQHKGLWAFDPSVPAPDGAEIHYGTHEPFLRGPLSTQLQAELRRRATIIRGTARPHNTHRFSGLMVCAECAHRMCYAGKRRGSHEWKAYACVSRTRADPVDCDNRAYVREDVIEEWLARQLIPAFAALDVRKLTGETRPPDPSEGLEREIDDVRKQVARLITKQARAPQELADLYDSQIDAAGKRLRDLETALQAAQTGRESESNLAERTTVLENIRDHGAIWLWGLDDTTINQTLSVLLGDWKIVIENGEPIGFAKVQRRRALGKDNEELTEAEP